MRIQLPHFCPECGEQEDFEAFLRDWPKEFVENQRVLVQTCWKCGYKRAAHVWLEKGYED